MLHIKKIEDGIDLYKALGSDLRIQISLSCCWKRAK